jgi:hypothetical protein
MSEVFIKKAPSLGQIESQVIIASNDLSCQEAKNKNISAKKRKRSAASFAF